MIRVTFYQNQKKEIIGFDCRNHSGYAEEGSDIVCAAVSVLTINTVNAIERFTDDVTDIRESEDADGDEPFITLRVVGEPSHDAELLLRTMASGIADVEADKSHGDFIDLIFEEV